MSEKNERIEDAFNEFLAGDDLRNALNFAEYLRTNEMIYNGEHEIHYKDELVCYIDAPNKPNWWTVWTVGDYSSEYGGFLIDERTKEIAWSNVVKCGNCDDVDCGPGKIEVIFGKEFTNVCNGASSLAMRFVNPNAEALECAKKMLEMAKYVIDDRSDKRNNLDLTRKDENAK